MRESALVSRDISTQIATQFEERGTVDFQLDRARKPSVDRVVQIAAPQYQQDPDEPKRRLMLRLGLAFAGAYLVFLIGWIWATRLRSRPRRN
jgi:hypothetical protein